MVISDRQPEAATGLELCEQLDAFDAVVVPFGGGGLTTGIASAVKALRPEVRVAYISSLEERIELLEGTGVDAVTTPNIADPVGFVRAIQTAKEHVAQRFEQQSGKV